MKAITLSKLQKAARDGQCRLIYFDEAANRRAQANLAAALRPGGVLVLGPADTLREPRAFEPIATSGATVYRKLA